MVAMIPKALLILLILTVGSPTFGQASASEFKPDLLWKEVAAATCVAKGRLTLPGVRSGGEIPTRRYVQMTLRDAVFIKQSKNAPRVEGETIAFKDFLSNETYDTPASLIKDLRNKEVIAFLTAEPTDGTLYLAHGRTSLQRSTPELIKRIQQEAQQQEKLLATYSTSEAAKPDTHDKAVADLIDEFLTPTAQRSFKQLEQMGWDAVPSLIRRMDDRRLVGKPISLQNRSPKAFESVRHYHVANVLQTIDAILGQITGDFFVPSYSEGAGNSNEEISLAGWRLSLLYGFSNRPKP